MRLPPEVRNVIYSLTLIYDHPLKTAGRSDPSAVPKSIHVGALRHSCREIRNDCTKLFYANNTFVIRLDPNAFTEDSRLDIQLAKFNGTLANHGIKALRPVIFDLREYWDLRRSSPYSSSFDASLVSTLKSLSSPKQNYPCRLRFTIKPKNGGDVDLEFSFPGKCTLERAVDGVFGTLWKLSEVAKREERTLSCFRGRNDAAAKTALYELHWSLQRLAKNSSLPTLPRVLPLREARACDSARTIHHQLHLLTRHTANSIVTTRPLSLDHSRINKTRPRVMDNSPLARLSAELLNEIYGCVLSASTPSSSKPSRRNTWIAAMKHNQNLTRPLSVSPANVPTTSRSNFSTRATSSC